MLSRSNSIVEQGNGLYERYAYPVLTAAHVPLFWEYDLNPETNPFFMKRFGINATFNAGAIKFGGKYLLVAGWKGMTENRFSQLLKVKMELISSHFGTIRWTCHPQIRPT